MKGAGVRRSPGQIVDARNVLLESARFEPNPGFQFAQRKACRGFHHRLGVGLPIGIVRRNPFRQRPASARGVLFITIEDEIGVANSIPLARPVREAAPR